jgi:hypothetical protein
MEAHRVVIRPPQQKNVTYSFGRIVYPVSATGSGSGNKNACISNEFFNTNKDILAFGINLSVTRGYNADFDKRYLCRKQED